MVNQFRCHVFEVGIVSCQLDADFKHVLAEQCHPSSAVSLLQVAPGGQWGAAVENADVVEPQKAPLEEVLAEAVFTVHPPTEVQHQLCKRAFEELHIALSFERLFGPV